MSKQLAKNVDSVVKLSNFAVINEDFTRCRCNIFYTGRNRNYTDITEEALNKLIETKNYANKPVVAHLIKDNNGNYKVGGHDYLVEINGNGTECVDLTVPFGVIPEDCNPAIEEFTEKSGAKKKYFCVDLVLWTHRYPIMDAAFNDDIYFNQSMEIVVNSCYSDGDYLVINDFSLSALCLLNKSNGQDNVEPCFEQSAVRKYTADMNQQNFKQNFDELLRRYSLSKNKKGDDNRMKEKLVNALKGFKFTDISGEEKEKYALISFTDDTVGLFDRTSAKVYSVKFTKENDEIAFDFDNATEAALTLSEKTDSSFDHLTEISLLCSYSAIKKENELKSGIAERIKQLDDERKAESEAFAALKQQHSETVEELTKYQKAEQEANEKKHRDSVDALIKEYESQLRLSTDYIAYASDVKRYSKSIADIRNDLDLMLGRYSKAQEQTDDDTAYRPVEYGAQMLNFSFDSPKKSREEAEYGDLLERQRMKHR